MSPIALQHAFLKPMQHLTYFNTTIQMQQWTWIDSQHWTAVYWNTQYQTFWQTEVYAQTYSWWWTTYYNMVTDGQHNAVWPFWSAVQSVTYVWRSTLVGYQQTIAWTSLQTYSNWLTSEGGYQMTYWNTTWQTWRETSW